MNKRRQLIIQSYYFLPYDTENGETIGGGIRYLRDIGKLFYDQGYDVKYIQKSRKNFNIKFEDWAEVQGIASPIGAWSDPIFSKKAYELTGNATLICYGNMEDCFPFVRPNSFAIQHGIWWDYPIPLWKKNYQEYRVKFVARHVGLVVCVDTNFINWYRTKWPKDTDALKKLRYVPNYADIELFKPEKNIESNRKILLFPRRFEIKRGYELFIEMCSELKKKGHSFDVSIVGAGRSQMEIEALIREKSIGNSINITNADFDSIHKYYQSAYLTFVPTLWSEGTSFSAIEAICSGSPVITSDVGGLGNIIIPGYNGDICNPNVNDFINMASFLLDNPEIRDQMSRNCINMRESFSKTRWENRILNLTDKLI